MRYYDDGGVVSPELDPSKEKQLNDFLMSSQMKQGMNQTSGGPSTPPASGSPPPPSDMSQNKENEVNEKIADSHPGLKPDELTPYLKGQEAQVDTFGPEKQAALMQHLQQGYKSPGNLLAKGGATLADAIMQGVARAGNSGNLAAINERENANLNRTAEMGKSLQEQNLKGGEVKRGLEEQSPTTPLGAANLPLLQAVGKAYGMDAQAVQAMMKTNPQTAIKLLDKFGEFATGKMKAAIEQQLKLLEIQVQQNLGQQGKNIEGQRVKNEALKDTASHGILHPINAWKASQQLADDGSGVKQFNSVQEAESAGLPVGTRVSIGGKMATIK